MSEKVVQYITREFSVPQGAVTETHMMPLLRVPQLTEDQIRALEWGGRTMRQDRRTSAPTCPLCKGIHPADGHGFLREYWGHREECPFYECYRPA